jgi:epoxyqueuosine reductase
MQPQELAHYIQSTIREKTHNATTITRYREPLVRWVKANNPQFEELKTLVHPDLMLPQDMLPGAKSVLAFFLPFDERIPKANAVNPEIVAVEWAQAYIETNKLLKHITDTLIHDLVSMGIRAHAALPTHNFDPATLKSSWSHKSIAVITGLGSFGLHRMVITDAGCAGRFSSLVLDADLPDLQSSRVERCLYFAQGSCTICVERCPIRALKKDGTLDKMRCSQRCRIVGEGFKHLGLADVCGKCAVGPCAYQNPVKY